MDFKGKPFGPIPALCSIAEEVTKVHAILRGMRTFSQLFIPIIQFRKTGIVREKDEYIPLCRECYLAKQKRKTICNSFFVKAPLIQRKTFRCSAFYKFKNILLITLSA